MAVEKWRQILHVSIDNDNYMVDRKIAIGEITIYKNSTIYHSSQEIMMTTTANHYDHDDDNDLCNSAQWPNVNVESPQQ